MDIEKMLETMSSVMRQGRRSYHLTLGQLISFLEERDGDLPIRIEGMDCHLGEPDSYRGYYEDLAFRPAAQKIDVDTLLFECKKALHKTFTGYKGGDYTMDEDTPLWISEHGSASGISIIDVDCTDEEVVMKVHQVD